MGPELHDRRSRGAGDQFRLSPFGFVASPGARRRVQGLNPGQPKLCGLEILSGSHVPDEWRGALASPDFRGHRIKTYRLTDKESAYQSRVGKDLVASKHGAFRPIGVKMGPDGAISWPIYTTRSFSMAKWIFVIPGVITSMGEFGGSVFRKIPRRLLPSLPK